MPENPLEIKGKGIHLKELPDGRCQIQLDKHVSIETAIEIARLLRGDKATDKPDADRT